MRELKKLECPLCKCVLEIITDGCYAPFGITGKRLTRREAWIYQCPKCKTQVWIPIKLMRKRKSVS